MQKSFSVLNSDRINKYGYLIPISVMEGMMWMKATEGVPMHLGHDMHRPIGCMIPFALYFEPHLVRNLGLSLIPETDDELKQIIDFKKYSTYDNLKEEIDKNGEKLYGLLKDNISQNYKYLIAGTLAIVDKNIVESLFQNLIELKDKSGLINIQDLKKDFTYKYHGVFIHNTLPLCLYSHSYFRKSLSRYNNFHHLFLDEFMSHHSDENITLKIALDWDIIGYAPTFSQTLEFEYWFGPKYNNDIDKINHGLTVHNCNDFEKKYHEISSTEFYWKNNEHLKEFELEELRENNTPTIKDFFGCRYIHSIFDTKKKIFIHFDGAIRGYSSDLYFERIDQKMTDFGRKSDYTKLFRIDGALDLKDWKNLITKYMQGNPLIYEYFEIDKPKSQFKSTISKTLLQELVPHSINRSEGIRLLVSYHNKNEEYKNNTHSISIYDVITIDDIDYSILEFNIIEIKKALDRLGKNLFIKENCLFGDVKDEYWNIPCVFHSAVNPTEDIKVTLLVLKNVFIKMIERKLNSVISFTISWNMEDKEVRVSCFGHIDDLYQWMLSFEEIPVNRSKFKIWLDSQKKYINSNFQKINEKPLVQDISQFDGVIYMKRVMIDEKFNVTPIEEENGLTCSFVIPNKDYNHYAEIVEGSIKPVMAYIIKKCTCSKSNQDYIISPHSKILDDDVYTIIEKVEGLSFYWSDKPIY